MKVQPSKGYKILAPRPVILVSTVNAQGISNAAPISFCMPISMEPPLIAFASAPDHDTVKNVLEIKDFVINIPAEDILDKLWVCKKSFPYGVSEIKEAKLTEEKSKSIKSPRIKECLAKFECKLFAQYETGDHLLIIGEIVEAEVADNLMKDGKFQVDKAKALMHIGSDEFGLLGKIVKAK